MDIEQIAEIGVGERFTLKGNLDDEYQQLLLAEPVSGVSVRLFPFALVIVSLRYR